MAEKGTVIKSDIILKNQWGFCSTMENIPHGKCYKITFNGCISIKTLAKAC